MSRSKQSIEVEGQLRVRIDKCGRILVPSKLRKKLGWGDGDTLLLARSNEAFTLRRWEGTERELACMETAQVLADLIDSVPSSDRKFLRKVLVEKHGIVLNGVISR